MMLPVSRLCIFFAVQKRGEREEDAVGNVRINIAYRYVISDVFGLNKIMKLTRGKCRAKRGWE